MEFGYECEYFLLDKAGELVYNVPTDLPYDAAGTLVEVRSKPSAILNHTWLTFKWAKDELLTQLNERGLKLHNVDRYEYPALKPHSFRGRLETAGFHIHFSGPGAEKRTSIITNLNARFEQLIHASKRDVEVHEPWRTKPYGWEYRMLPATADPLFITARLQEIFKDSKGSNLDI